MEGLARLEYRGYDSAGLAVVGSEDAEPKRRRCVGQVKALAQNLRTQGLSGEVGIAHTRWATHGTPSEENAHPLVSGTIALVHNGIIENFRPLRSELEAAGYRFESNTDSEVIVHLIHHQLVATEDLAEAVRAVVKRLQGQFALAVISSSDPDCIVAVRSGSPLVLGCGDGQNSVASDASALAGLARQAVFLEEGDLATIAADRIAIEDRNAAPVTRSPVPLKSGQEVRLGQYEYHLQREIFAHPDSIRAVLADRLQGDRVSAFDDFAGLLDRVEGISIAACGSSYLAAEVARHWFEELAGLPCQAEIASEYRYRAQVIQPNTLFLTLSQSGETADTLAAFKKAQGQGYLTTLSMCNAPLSSLPRLSDIEFMLNAGPEISVASTKVVSASLVALLLLAMTLARRNGLTSSREAELVGALRALPEQVQQVLQRDADFEQQAVAIASQNHALFIGRRAFYPIALEGALKLKELSYIHAEGHAAGELKHGPLALVDENMPVIALAPADDLISKLESNLQEIKARGGRLYVITDQSLASRLQAELECAVIPLPDTHAVTAPILYLVSVQLLACHVGLHRNTNLDQPRNLAKSVTVE